MKYFQKWFEQFAGFSRDEQERLARARAIFADAGSLAPYLEKPACWRRKPRISVALS